jgi:TetR/AcrR family transcriptional regulator, cholesterol catabolism regulator
MKEKEQKIIEGATEIFLRLGIKSVNMDDIARELGMSKKTLYLHVQDKKDLVGKAMQWHIDQEDNCICNIQDEKLNAIDQFFEIMMLVNEMLKSMHPSILYDIQKYYPEMMKSMMDNRQKMIRETLLANMKQGQKEGLYRKDFNPDVIIEIYVHSIEGIFNHNWFANIGTTPSELYLELFRYHIRGIASEKGIEYLIKRVKEKQKNMGAA